MATGCWAALGVLLGHAVTYRIVFPDHDDRAHVLHHSGHGWAAMILPGALLFAVAAVVASALNARHAPSRPFGWSALAVLQSVAFLALELAERLVHGGSITAALHDLTAHRGFAVLLLGVLVQCLAALAAVWVARRIEKWAALEPRPAASIVLPRRFVDLVAAHKFTGFTPAGRAPPRRSGPKLARFDR